MAHSNRERPFVLGAGETLQSNDTVVAVVATTGTGKTTFINNIAGALLPLNDSLRSACTGVQAVVIPGLARRRLVLVEIPGCESISMTDVEIQGCVKDWLGSKYKGGKFSGVVLLHNPRHQLASTQFLLDRIKKYCKKDMCKHLMLATTSHDKRRENFMASGGWKSLIDQGATIFRLANTVESALELVITLLAKDQSVSHAERLEFRNRQTKSPKVTLMPPPSRDPHDSSETALSVYDQGDTIIALMGPSGTGKSSFVNMLMGQSVAYVNDSVESCTQEVQAFTCNHPDGSGRKVIIIDTPGFDDSQRTDYEILHMTVQWLTKTYKQRVLLTGIIQFCSIADTRMRGTPLKNLKIFEELCGPDALKNVILATTFWDQVNANVGSKREAQLKSVFWAEMIAHGCHVTRFNPRTYESAWDIVHIFDTIVSQPQVLRVQTEMVDEGKALNDTSAFKMLSNWLAGVVKKVKGKAPRSRSGKTSNQKGLPSQASRRD